MGTPKSTKIIDLHEDSSPLFTMLVDVFPDGNGPFFVKGEWDENGFELESAWDEILDGYERPIPLTVLNGYGIGLAVDTYLTAHFNEEG